MGIVISNCCSEESKRPQVQLQAVADALPETEETEVPVAKDTIYFRHRIWRDEAVPNLEASSLRASSHSMRRS